MKLEPTIEMSCDLLASQILKMDDINIQSRKKNRQIVLDNRKAKMMETLKLMVVKFRHFRLKLVRLERENNKLKQEISDLRRQVNTGIDQDILEENQRLIAQLDEIRTILAQEPADEHAEDQRLSA